MNILCNPVTVPYPYQFKYDPRDKGRLSVNREAADPSMVQFQGKYYLFASMTGAVWVSEDMAHWESHPLPENLPIYDYAPDVRVMDDWLYFTASNRGKPCDFYRTKDPINGPYEQIKGTFDFWDPHMFLDDDGKLYFYWGCSNSTPIWGVELDRETMRPLADKVSLISGDPWHHGYERFGEDHCQQPRTEAETEMLFAAFLKECDQKHALPPKENYAMIRATFSGMPYIEGPWMTKHDGRYYLQYACPGAEINVYADGVYVSEHPLGPFVLAKNNPFSYHPGGFMPGAGHGSTIQDRQNAWWHTATMRISMNHVFERRVGIWPAGFDAEGNLYCNQRYGDWPMDVDALRKNPWADPSWYLLSFGKQVTASSYTSRHKPEYAVDENAQTWWRAKNNQPAEWLKVDLGKSMTLHAIQINFADDPAAAIACPASLTPGPDMPRWIDLTEHHTRWMLDTSADGVQWAIFADKRQAKSDLSHDLVLSEQGIQARFVRLTVMEVPFGAAPCVSGLRIFGKGNGDKPAQADAQIKRVSDLDFTVSAARNSSVMGYNILWGYDADHLYHSYLIMGNEIVGKKISALIQGQGCFVRVDTFNENGITAGVAESI